MRKFIKYSPAHYLGVLYLHLTVLTKEPTIDTVEDLLVKVKEDGVGVASITGTFIGQLFLVCDHFRLFIFLILWDVR